MRIRKLAKDLDCSSEQLLSLLQRIGQSRYKDAEQQLPDPVIQLVRRHAGELKQERAWKPPEAGPIRRFDGPAARAVSAEDESVLGLHLAGVKPLHAPKAAPAKATPPRVAPARPAPVRASVAGLPPRVTPPPPPSPSVPVVAAPPSPDPAVPSAGGAPSAGMAAAPLAFALAQQEVALLRGELSAIAAERGELAAERAALRVERERARAEVEAALAARDGLLRRAEEAEAEAARLRAASTAVRLPPEVVPVRQLLDARGLRGDDEMGRALSAIVEGRRSRELLDALVLADGSAFAELLDDRVLLVQAGEEVPNGLVGATVGADRSESADTPAVRTAVSRLATAFLVHGLRRLVVIGGPGALLRVLHDALDPRIELRLLPAPSGSGLLDVAPGSVVVLWGAAADDRRLAERLPTAGRVWARDLPRFCAGVVDHLSRS